MTLADSRDPWRQDAVLPPSAVPNEPVDEDALDDRWDRWMTESPSDP